jgi:16S rRNA (cytidine1402-2'-O)-methyltransferase
VSDTGSADDWPGGSVAIPPFRAEPGALYVVATPIGNLRDVTLRAVDILRSVDVIAAEDTRVTATLLRRYDVATAPTPLHQHNEARRSADLVAMLADGRSVALVSDAGTPGISDPGARLVRAVRDAGHRVVPIPGPAALATAVAAAGLRAECFAFLGFLPQQGKARAALLASVAPLPLALVCYEAPHRVRRTVADLAAALGARDLVVARELTKAFETISVVPLPEAAEWLGGDPNRERGEFVLIVDAPASVAPAAQLSAQDEQWLRALLRELPPARAARIVSEVTGASRQTCYARAMQIKDQRGGEPDQTPR